jgi:hypothetical protein
MSTLPRYIISSRNPPTSASMSAEIPSPQHAAASPPRPPPPLHRDRDALIHCLSLLTGRERARCAQTCSHWSVAASYPAAWAHWDASCTYEAAPRVPARLRPFLHRMTFEPKKVEGVDAKPPHLTAPALAEFTGITDLAVADRRHLDAFLRFTDGPKLRRIAFRVWTGPAKSMHEYASFDHPRMSSLEEFVIHSGTLSGNGMELLLKCGATLKTLSCGQVDDASFCSHLHRLPQLSSLTLHGTTAADFYLTSAALKPIPTLTYLELSEMQFRLGNAAKLLDSAVPSQLHWSKLRFSLGNTDILTEFILRRSGCRVPSDRTGEESNERMVDITLTQWDKEEELEESFNFFAAEVTHLHFIGGSTLPMFRKTILPSLSQTRMPRLQWILFGDAYEREKQGQELKRKVLQLQPDVVVLLNDQERAFSRQDGKSRRCLVM